jgi:hypothetical protein
MGVGGEHLAQAALPIVTGRRVEPTAGLDGCGKYRLHQDSIPGPSSQ